MLAMLSRAAEIVTAYGRFGWTSEPYDAFLALEADELPELVFACLNELEDAPTFFDHALSLIDEVAFAEGIARAIPAVTDGDGPAVAVIYYASLQVPQLLAPHLAALWEPAARNGVLTIRPWRGADRSERDRLLAELERAETRRFYSDEHVGAQRAALALLESRDESTVRQVLASSWAPAQPSAAMDAHIRAVGFDPDGPRRLAPDGCWHLALPEALIADRLTGAAHLHPDRHPTWRGLGAPVAHGRLGGRADGECGSCGGRLHRLLLLPAVPPGLGVSLAALEIATCLSCLGWEQPELFYHHDTAGRPDPLQQATYRIEPEFPAEPLLDGEVGLVPTPDRWRLQNWGAANGRENLHRLGGEPTWIQGPDYPRCPACRSAMTALLQLDSDLPTADGGEWLWGSGGIGYVSWCDTCAISCVQWQCT